MATQGGAATDAETRTVVYHDGQYGAPPDIVAAGLDDCDAVAVSDVRSIGRDDPAPADRGLPVVFAETVPENLPAEHLPTVPAVWVTTDGEVLRGAIERDAVDAVLWRPGDGWETLAAKLRSIARRPDVRLRQPAETVDGSTEIDGRDGDVPIGAEDTALYEYLIRTVGDAVYVLDEEGRFTFVNDAMCELTGYERAELVGSSVHAIKDDATVAEAEEALRDLLRRSGTADARNVAKLDLDLIGKDGERVTCTDRMTLRPSDDDGNLTGTVGTLRDVSGQQRREDILGGLLEATQEMVRASTTAEVAQLVTETAVDVLDIDLVVLREFDPETGTLAPTTISEAAAERMPERPTYESGEGPAGTAFEEDRLVVVSDLDAHDDRDRGDLDAGAFLPVGDRRTLSVSHRAGGFDDEELRFLELLAATAGSVFERVERGEELRRYEAVVETAEELLFTTDAEGRFALVTAPLAEHLGHDRESLTGLPVSDVFPDESFVEDVVDDPTASASETVVRTRDGELLPSRVSIAPIGGPESGVVGTVRDIRELQSAKREASRQRRRFRELFETLTDPVADVEYDDGAVVRGVNPSFTDLCDCGEESVRGSPLSAVREELPDGLAAALSAVETPGSSVERTVEARTGAGRRYFLLKTVPYDGDEGRRAFLILTDVTELERRGTHLSVLQRLLRHNLRTETTVIQGYAERLIDSDAEHVRAAGRRIRAASRSLVDTSDTARTIQRVLRADFQDADTVGGAALADRLEDRLSERFPNGDVSVSGRPAVETRVSDRLGTAVCELVDNALTHAGRGPTVTVELAAVDGDLRIAVRDDGSGIPDAEWALVTGDREITQLRHTSGLGLWLVKWIADRHGGRLERTAGDDGSAVAIRLPTA